MCPCAIGHSGKVFIWDHLSYACHHVWHVGKGLVKYYVPNGRRNFVVMTAYDHGAVDRFWTMDAYLIGQLKNQLEVINYHGFNWFALYQLSRWLNRIIANSVKCLWFSVLFNRETSTYAHCVRNFRYGMRNLSKGITDIPMGDSTWFSCPD